MFEAKRLHPIAIVLNIIKTVKDLLFPIILLLIVPSREGGFIEPKFLFVLIWAAVIIMIVLIAVITWMRFTYRVEDGELKIESGLFVRNKRYIRFERIHSIDISEGIFHRPFGLVKVNIETAGGGKAEAVLSAIRKTEATELKNHLAAAKREEVDEENEAVQAAVKQPQAVYKQTFSELFFMAATSGAVGVVLSGAAALFSQIDDLIRFDKIVGEYKEVIQLGAWFLAGIVLFILLIVYLLATLSMMFKYANFTVEKLDDELVISRGLLEKRKLTIPLKKVQGIRIVESIVRQPFGFATVYLEYAGGSLENADSLKIMLFPLVKKRRIQRLLEDFLPEYVVYEEVTQVPKRAYRRYVFRFLIVVVPIIALSLYFFRPWSYALLFLIPFSFFWAYLQFKAAGWNLADKQLLLRSRGISKTTLLFQKNKIQSIEVSTSWMQRRANLATISALIKSGLAFRSGQVVDIEKNDFTKVEAWFLTGKKKEPEL